jgi:hypothetical protein
MAPAYRQTIEERHRHIRQKAIAEEAEQVVHGGIGDGRIGLHAGHQRIPDRTHIRLAKNDHLQTLVGGDYAEMGVSEVGYETNQAGGSEIQTTVGCKPEIDGVGRAGHDVTNAGSPFDL